MGTGQRHYITVDLNPLSRTAQTSTVTIVDNIVRAMPLLIKYVEEFEDYGSDELTKMINNFDNKVNLDNSIRDILNRFEL